MNLRTACAHGVRAGDPETLGPGARSTPSVEPITLASVYDFESIAASERPLVGDGGYAYARYGHPNGRSFELGVAALEGAEDAVATSSGMAAVACTVMAVASAGARVAIQGDAYGGTVALLERDFARFGVEVVTVDAYAPDAVPAGAALLLVETISNPLCREVDVAALARRTPLLVVDNTFATPILARPLAEGARLVLHSATKFLGGHHDVTGGVVCGPADLIKEIRGVVKRFGAQISPMDAWLASRGMKTLAVRMDRACANAAAITAWLRGRVPVNYPGRGAVLSFEVPDAARFVDAVSLLTLTPSLGGTTSTLSHPTTSSHRAFTPAQREALGIRDGLLRLSVGIEAVEDVIADVERGLTR